MSNKKNNDTAAPPPKVDFEKEFRDRVLGVGHVLPMMAPWHSPEYLTRVWCIFEIFTAMQADDCEVTIIMPPREKERLVQVIIEGGKASASGDTASSDKSGTGLDALYEALAKTHVENAQASKPEDRETILAMLEKGPGFVMTNAKVNEYIRGWIRATMLDIVDRKTHMLLSSKATRNEKLDGASHFIRIDDLLDRNGEHEAALGPVPKGSRVQEEWLGPMHHATAQIYRAIGTCLDKMGNSQAALELYSKALRVHQAVNGEQHPNTARVYNDCLLYTSDAADE